MVSAEGDRKARRHHGVIGLRATGPRHGARARRALEPRLLPRRRNRPTTASRAPTTRGPRGTTTARPRPGTPSESRVSLVDGIRAADHDASTSAWCHRWNPRAGAGSGTRRRGRSVATSDRRPFGRRQSPHRDGAPRPLRSSRLPSVRSWFVRRRTAGSSPRSR